MTRTNILIIGLGLIGGSIARDLSARKGEYRVLAAARRQEVLDEAKQSGWIEEGWTDEVEAAKVADIAVLCVPVCSMPDIALRIGTVMPKGSVITDVGSVKGFLLDKITGRLPDGVSYVAAHPMAGSEKSGLAAAEEGLFKGRPFVIIPAPGTPGAATDKVCALAAALEAKTMTMSADKHDLAVAMISHMPHVVAAALMLAAAGDEDTDKVKELAAGCFRDMTRVAGADVRMWTDICLTNGEAVVSQFEKLQAVLSEAIGHVKSGDQEWLEGFFGQARDNRVAFGLAAGRKEEKL